MQGPLLISNVSVISSTDGIGDDPKKLCRLRDYYLDDLYFKLAQITVEIFV